MLDSGGRPANGGQPADSRKAELAAVISREKRLQALLDKRLAAINGTPGEPRSFDELHSLIEKQHYRIARWQAGTHEINYRRFFAIDTLIGLHMENPAVFKECHALVGRLLSLGLVSGLRIDHIDGLRQPEAYLQRLQSLDRTDMASPLYVVVEKILAHGESLPESWPVHGTTGYEFIADIAALQTDASMEAAFTRIYRDYTGDSRTYGEVVRKSKRLVIDEMFANAVNNLGMELVQIVGEDRDWRDLTRHELTTAVSELAAHFPVYRTYRSGPRPMGPEDSGFVEAACAAAIADNPRADPQPFEFVRDLIIGRYPPKDAPASVGAAIVSWVLTFQQYSGAIMAKAVEDTAFYNYNRLVALNEVGCTPGRIGGRLDDLHRANERRLAHMGSSLLATSTHDSKFSEDVRARLCALSEIPEEWSAWLAGWARQSGGLLSEIDNREAPDASDRYRFFQELLAIWPFEPSSGDEGLRERLRNHLRKVVDEAKRHTSILNKNEDYLRACDRFCDGLTNPGGAPGFLESFEAAAGRIARLGMVNSLAQLVLKCTIPGVPDFYQGCETWSLSLVDPDNRRPVDYERAKRQLEESSDSPVADLLRDWRSGAIKVRLTRELLHLRRSNRALFAFGDYRAIKAKGSFGENVFAFERHHSSGSLLVAVPRLSAKLGTPPLGEVWDDTLLEGATRTVRWRDIVTGRMAGMEGELRVCDLFSEAPFAVLHAQKEGA
jgi:(1->4)-alpha-D-glucan 1-alpha-D-glucosylmutase